MGVPSSARPSDARLDSWKEIAAYLKRDVTTVQRWEKREGMPVHRHLHDRMGSVYAFQAELDAWTRSRSLSAGLSAVQNKSSPVLLRPPAPSPAALARSTKRAKRRFVLSLAATAAILTVGAILWLQQTEYFWRNPLDNARFEIVTTLDGLEQAAALSSDGHLVAFLSGRDGPTDVWVTQVGSGELHNLTHGRFLELLDTSIRTLGFSPDGSLVTFWVHKPGGSTSGDIWAVPTLGGEPRQYLAGAAEFDWSRDGSRLTYHTPGPGDPMFVTNGGMRSEKGPVFTAPARLHSHFPLWSPDNQFLYFVQGELPDKLDIWRVRPVGGPPERITRHVSRVTYPVFLDGRTLMYLAGDPEASGSWLYSIDVERRIPHRLNSGLERYTSLAASTKSRRLVATLTLSDQTFWRLPIMRSAPATQMEQIPLTTNAGRGPRFGPDFLLYVSVTGAGESIWKLAHGTSTWLWRGEGAEIFGSPAVSPDGRLVAFSVRQHAQTLLYVMQADGANVRVVAGSLHLQGAPAWTPDGQSLTTAADDHGITHLVRVPIDGRPPVALVKEFSIDPTWSPDGRFVVYSGPDADANSPVKAVTAEGVAHPVPIPALTRGARHMAFLPGGQALMFLRGNMQHKELWLIDLTTGAERQLTNLAPDFDVRDFDISPDGREVVLERVQEHSNVVLVDLPKK